MPADHNTGLVDVLYLQDYKIIEMMNQKKLDGFDPTLVID